MPRLPPHVTLQCPVLQPKGMAAATPAARASPDERWVSTTTAHRHASSRHGRDQQVGVEDNDGVTSVAAGTYAD